MADWAQHGPVVLTADLESTHLRRLRFPVADRALTHLVTRPRFCQCSSEPTTRTPRADLALACGPGQFPAGWGCEPEVSPDCLFFGSRVARSPRIVQHMAVVQQSVQNRRGDQRCPPGVLPTPRIPGRKSSIGCCPARPRADTRVKHPGGGVRGIGPGAELHRTTSTLGWQGDAHPAVQVVVRPGPSLRSSIRS